MKFEVKWSPEMMDYYKHGSTIEYLDSNNIVRFNNTMLSPGATIVKWISNSNYQGRRGFLELPLLERGKAYQVKLDAESAPKPSALLKITFYTRAQEIIGTQLIADSEGDFTYPKKAYAYSIEILNNGIKELSFKSIVLSSYSKEREPLSRRNK
ncbi:accessory Sec system protein Asp3 [Lactococcus sp. DD01]|uniref:accessory Sec system protein Asp3 n=1 Tax=Lactococcus sp. DD01 TaxID=1776443 RepID=UPI0007760152|nr:accessory Sec system protein Asp3 [Lactococcus sp. DD01]KXT59349.1 Accessory secretory protein Asp3 [Lactococcus sp. DD01]